MVDIWVYQSLGNCAFYEYICLKNIKKLYKTAGKYDDQQQYKAIIEAEMFSTYEGCNDNSPMTHTQYNSTKKKVQGNHPVNFQRHWVSNIILLFVG